jgi:mRNA interferase RelE/StbE
VTNTPYHVRIAPAAQRHIRVLHSKNQRIIIKLIEALAVNPRPPGVMKIEGMTGLYCENVNQHRLIYKVEEQEVLLLLVL